MKKLFTVLFSITLSSSVLAQHSELAGIVGLNTAFFNSSQSHSTAIRHTAPILSFNFGVIDNINFGNFSIRTGLTFTGKGGNYIESDVPKNLRIYYFETPIEFIYQEHKGKEGIFLGAGPYFSVGLGGKNYVGDPKKTYSEDLNLYRETSLFRGGDIGAEGIIGYKLKSGYIVDINYDEGFANILADKTNRNDAKVLRNRTLGISVGYAF
jgi:hypothetical protein